MIKAHKITKPSAVSLLKAKTGIKGFDKITGGEIEYTIEENDDANMEKDL